MSRKLDARVAEKVMGFTKILKGWIHPASPASVLSTANLPNYSTDMNDAMEVVGMFNGGSFAVKTNDWATACIGTVSEPSVASSLSVAICLSALRAVGDNEWVIENFYNEEEE